MRQRLIILWLCLLAFGLSVTSAQTGAPVYRVELAHGLTTPAASLVRRALRQAEAANAQALIIEVQASGTVLSVAQPLARDLHTATIPVVVWVGPRGTNGGPGGVLLLAAAHLSALAPNTSIGFARPLVEVSGNFSDQTQQLVVNDVATELVGWQRERGRNPEWIDNAVRNGAIITTDQAQTLDPPLVDLVAATQQELLATLEGRSVTLANGSEQQLHTLGTRPITVGATAWETLGQYLALPTIAFLCFVVGALAITLELSTPGVGVPGASGAILIIAALYGFVLAQVRLLGVATLIVGLILIAAEAVVLAHGGLALAGIVLLILGALWLVDPVQTPDLQVAPLAIVGTVLGLGAALAVLTTIVVRVRQRPPLTGPEAMIGQIAEVRQAINPEGMVFINGALWQAWSDQGSFRPGEFVEIHAVENLRLYVVPLTAPNRGALEQT